MGLTDDWQHMIDSTTVCGHVSAAGGKGGYCERFWSIMTQAAEAPGAITSIFRGITPLTLLNSHGLKMALLAQVASCLRGFDGGFDPRCT